MMAHIHDLDEMLPDHFFIVAQMYCLGGYFSSNILWLAQTKEEAVEWVEKNVRGACEKEEGCFFSDAYGSKVDMTRWWIRVSQRSNKKEGSKPEAGIFVCVHETSRLNILVRMYSVMVF
jgi:hypothetical protein